MDFRYSALIPDQVSHWFLLPPAWAWHMPV
jgi:hypothetical protein